MVATVSLETCLDPLEEGAENPGVVLRLHAIVLAVLLGAIACTRTVTVQPATPTSSTTPIPTSVAFASFRDFRCPPEHEA
jgi:hypothetical protein